MQKENTTEKRKKRAGGFKLFLKSAGYTVIAMTLVAIGYFGAKMLLGS